MATIRTVLAMAAFGLLAACKASNEAPVPAAANPVPVEDRSGALLGKWTGPEGTFLLLEKKGAAYAVTVQNLDGPRTFEGKSEGGKLSFVRDGNKLTVEPTDGAGTGMKWLAGRQHCVVVAPGEGYCRD